MFCSQKKIVFNYNLLNFSLTKKAMTIFLKEALDIVWKKDIFFKCDDGNLLSSSHIWEYKLSTVIMTVNVMSFTCYVIFIRGWVKFIKTFFFSGFWFFQCVMNNELSFAEFKDRFFKVAMYFESFENLKKLWKEKISEKPQSLNSNGSKAAYQNYWNQK